jgi:hypothetical protein
MMTSWPVRYDAASEADALGLHAELARELPRGLLDGVEDVHQCHVGAL